MLFHSTLVGLGATLVAAVPSLEVKGNQFINPKTNKAFQIAGMAYQIGGSAGYEPSKGVDPLSDGDVCKRDAALMQIAGINTIRVYNLSPDINHDECASIFNAAGIYMVVDVNSPKSGESLNSLQPWTSYYGAYLNRTFGIVEAFKTYPNLLAFFSGNEVISELKQGGTAPPYIRAVTRDLKNYIKQHADRKIPVGYSAADVRTVLEDSWNYFQCSIEGEDDDMSRSDLFALNSYSWCGKDSSFETSGYNGLVELFKDSSIPIFFSEFGCNKNRPRFAEISTMYGDKMIPWISGGVVYEFAQEPNDYGLAEIESDKSVKLLADYNSLKSEYAKLDWTKVQGHDAAGSAAKPPKCTESLIKEKGFSTNFTLPVLPEVQKIIKDGVKPKPVGKIVEIKDFKVTHAVKNTDGTEVKNLAITPLANDKFNTPGANKAADTSSGNGTSDSSGSSSGSGSGSGSSASNGGGNGGKSAAFRASVGASSLVAPAIVVLSLMAGMPLM